MVSPAWDKLSRADVGAVTWARGTTGISGEINASNSLIGSTVSDQIGVNGVVVLPNGNYVVRSMGWDNDTATDAGAAGHAEPQGGSGEQQGQGQLAWAHRKTP